MSPLIKPTRVRYIKLGQGGNWEDSCARDHTIRLGFGTGEPREFELASAGRWDDFRQQLLASGARTTEATRTVNEVRAFFEDDGSTLWVTFIGDLLHWGFLTLDRPAQFNDGPRSSGTFRRVRDGWSSTSLQGDPLKKTYLPGTITSLASYRGTSCSVRDEQRLLARINGQRTAELQRAVAAQEELIAAAIPLIQSLHDRSFESLVDMVYSAAGWRRLGPVGGVTKTKDLDLQRPLSGESAFVQIKSRADQRTLDEYVDAFEGMGYQQMIFVFHTLVGARPLVTENRQVTLIDARDLARATIELGLMTWLIGQCS